ncbi:MAG TPA: NADH-quinone oxidoreductase subunit N [Methylomirabilota bacterium]|nr:NADH-quinone oxidoreductase subunit N [Methylomirabilota bacterium]
MTNTWAISLEIAVIAGGLILLMLDLWTSPANKRRLGYVAAGYLGCVLAATFFINTGASQLAFDNSYVMDGLALFFKRFFLVAAIIVMIIATDFADRIPVGVSEFYSLSMFALAGMMFAASANDFVMVFVSLELITITFYILTSFQRNRLVSLEAGVKYLIMGALSTAFTVYGIALVFGSASTTNFAEIYRQGEALLSKPLFLVGLLMVLFGISFKIAAFPFQIWTPDVYQGSPAPSTAFLAIGSKTAGFAILVRMLYTVAPSVFTKWGPLMILVGSITILYGNLCAIPQRNLKRLLGYSSIANAGYLLLGIAAGNQHGSSAILFYLAGYLFSVLAAFAVISVVAREANDEDVSIVAGLHKRSPLLAATLALAMISLAGIPPLAGFFGKFLLLRAVIERATAEPIYFWLIGAALIGIVISFYYYLGVVHAMYWGKATDESTLRINGPMVALLYACIVGMLYLGVFPNPIVKAADAAIASVKL